MIERSCGWLSHHTKGELIKTSPASVNLCFKGVSTDSRQIMAGQLFIPLVGEHFDGHDFLDTAIEKRAVAALWQQDVPLPENRSIPFILVADTLQAMQKIASQYRREADVSLVALTGSNGKTTTKDLLGAILRGQYQVHQTKGNLNNHIGVPLTLLSMPESTEVAVVEMGMNHAGEIATLSQIAKPDLAVITNIGESHIEFLGSREAIAQAKLEIREGLAEEGALFINGDEPLLRSALSDEQRSIVYVGWGEDNDEAPQKYELNDLKGVQFQSPKTGYPYHLPLLGQHNVINALLAIAVGRYFDIAEKTIQKQLQSVEITGGRLQVLVAQNGMTIINDAYNASPTSMKAALQLHRDLETQKEKWALLGDMLEIGRQEETYHRDIGDFAVQMGMQRIYTLGKRGKWIADGAIAVNEDTSRHIRHFANLEEVTAHFQQEGNENVLLLVKASQGAKLETVVDQII